MNLKEIELKIQAGFKFCMVFQTNRKKLRFEEALDVVPKQHRQQYRNIAKFFSFIG